MSEKKAAPAKAAPAKAVKTEQVQMKRSGAAKGRSGYLHKFKAGDVLTVPEGEFDHLFSKDGSSKHAVKK